MNSKDAIFRGTCFAIVYSLFYAVPVFVLQTAPLTLMQRIPALVGNLCFIVPQYAFPFDRIFWKYHSEIHSLNGYTALLISLLYLVLTAWSFSFLTRSVKKVRWIVLFAFYFSILLIIASNLVTSVLSIFGIDFCLSVP